VHFLNNYEYTARGIIIIIPIGEWSSIMQEVALLCRRQLTNCHRHSLLSFCHSILCAFVVFSSTVCQTGYKKRRARSEVKRTYANC